MNKTKRERGKNFTEKEKRIFCDIIANERFRTILENKKTDYETSRTKCAAWVEIVKIFNSRSDEEERLLIQLKTYYENLKAKWKKSSFQYPPALAQEDGQILMEIVQQHTEVIDNTKPEFGALKKVVWDVITNEFNSKSRYKRTSSFLEMFYKHHKLKNKTTEPNNDTSCSYQARNASDTHEHFMDNLQLNTYGNTYNPNLANRNSEEENVLLHDVKEMPESPDCTNINSYEYEPEIIYPDNSDPGPSSSRHIPNNEHRLHAKEGYLENYYLLKTKLIETELEAKHKEMENRERELQERLNIYCVEKRLKEQELKLKEIETNIKLEEWKNMIKEKYTT